MRMCCEHIPHSITPPVMWRLLSLKLCHEKNGCDLLYHTGKKGRPKTKGSWHARQVCAQKLKTHSTPGAKSSSDIYYRSSPVVSLRGHLWPGWDDDSAGHERITCAAAPADSVLRLRVQTCHHRAWHFWWTETAWKSVSLHKEGKNERSCEHL